MKNTTFNYGGLTFKPLRTMNAREKKMDIGQFSKHLEIDTEHRQQFSSPMNGGNYSYEGFYSACDNDKADFFECLDNGKTYIPAHGFLYIYNK